jgi:hypothetical protein
MTCVWDSLIDGIFRDKIIYDEYFDKKPNPYQFVEFVKSKNKMTNIKVNDNILTEKEKKENFEAIKCFNIGSINQGYLCSTSDPFLILVCEIFGCSIIHKYLNTTIKYEHENPKNNLCNIYICSSRGHMSFQKYEKI